VRWPWQRAQAGPIEPRRASINSNGNGKAMELQAAKRFNSYSLSDVFVPCLRLHFWELYSHNYQG